MGHHSFDSRRTTTTRYEILLTMLQDSFYKSLTPEQNRLAHANEYDLDSPDSIDFDKLYECLSDLKQG